MNMVITMTIQHEWFSQTRWSVFDLIQKSPPAWKPNDEMENGDGAAEDDRIDDNDEGGNYFDQMGWDLTGGDDIRCGAQVCHFSNAPFGRFLSPTPTHRCPSSNIYKRPVSQNTDKKACSLPFSFLRPYFASLPFTQSIFSPERSHVP